jgi:hypothetical protein
LNDASRQWLAHQFPSAGPWDAADVSIHFDGRGGENSIGLALLAGHAVAYAPDALDAGGSGNLLAAGSTGPELLLSFASAAAVDLEAAGGQLLIDLSSAAASALSLHDAALAAAGWSQLSADSPAAPARFHGFDALTVVGGSGSQAIDLVGLDAATSLIDLHLVAGNTADLLGQGAADTANDRIRVHAVPASTRVTIAAGQGDDLIELGDPSHWLGGILAPIQIDGGSGHDQLIVNDSGDASGDVVLITQTTLAGIAGSPAAAIDFTNIDLLGVTASAGGDTIDAAFAPGSDLDAVTLQGSDGSDQFLLVTSDQTAGGLATGIETIDLVGGDGDDVFGQLPASLLPGTLVGAAVRMIRPSASTRIRIDLGLPALPIPPAGDRPGDVLNLDASALAGPVLVTTVERSGSPGSARSLAAQPGFLPVEYAGIDDLNLADRGRLTETAMGDVFLRGTSSPETFRFAPVHSDMARVRIGGADRLLTISGRAVVQALGGNDVVEMALPKGAVFYGGDGDDTLTGNSAADKLVGGAGRDRIDGSGGDNTLWGDWDPVEQGLPDTLANRQAAAESLPGRVPDLFFADILTGLSGHDAVHGGPGIDQITTAGGDDWVHAGQGADVVSTGAGDDRVLGGDGNDHVNLGEGDDLASGGAGDDTLLGLAGHDVLAGDAGNDALEGETGHDALFDGSLKISGALAAARAKGDAADAALAALLADWRADFALQTAVVDDHAGNDRLRGGLGRDAFSALLLAEILDLVLLDDRRL